MGNLAVPDGLDLSELEVFDIDLSEEEPEEEDDEDLDEDRG